jgi:putative PIN family toxin of toxin-antitoxin system
VRTVIDTNIWISFLISNLLKGFDALILSGKIAIITSEEQLNEIIEVLHRPKFRKHISEDDISEFLAILYKTAKIVKTGNEIKDCRDMKDNFILEIAMAGNASVIVTGDKDLLELNPYRGKKIVTPKEFELIMSALK